MKHFQNYGGTFGKKEETDQPHQHPPVSGRGYCQVPSAGYPAFFESEEGQREFAQWKKEQEEKKKEKE